MDERAHFVEKVIFDVAFDSESAALDKQAALTEFFQANLLSIVAEVFDGRSDPGVVTQIERLEIDLGAIPTGVLHDELVVRLRQALESALDDVLPRARSGDQASATTRATAVVRSTTRERTELELLQSFLATGHLPWNAVSSGADFDRLFARVVLSSGPEFVAYLRSSVRHEWILRRLVTQAPPAVLEALVKEVAPSDAGLILEFVRERRPGTGVTERATRRQAAELDFWRLIFGRMLGDTLPVTALPELLENAAARSGFEAPSTYEDRGAGHDEQDRERATDAEYEVRLADALLGGDVSGLRTLWRTLHRGRPHLLEQALVRHGQRPDVRTTIAAALIGEMFNEALRMLVPSHAQAIAGVLKGAGDAAPEDSRRLEWQRLARERVFGHVLATRGSDFDAAAFAESLTDGRGLATEGPPRATTRSEADEGVAAFESSGVAAFEDSGVAADRSKALGDRLVRALRDGTLAEFRLAWQLLRTGHDGSLRRILLRHLREATLRRRIATVLPEDLFLDLLRFLEPEAFDVVEAISCHPELFDWTDASEVRSEGHAAALGHLIREFTLAHIVLERPDPVRLDLLVESIIRRIAIHQNRHYPGVIDGIDEANSRRSPAEPPVPLQEILRELKADASSAAATEALDRARAVGFLRSFEQYELLRSHIVPGVEPVPVARKPLDQVIDDLADDHPMQLRKLFRELQFADAAWQGKASGLSPDVVASLVQAMLGISEARTGEPSPELRAAISDLAARSDEPTAFLVQVLDRMVRGDVIDFPAIMEGQALMSPLPPGEMMEPAPATAQLPVSTPDLDGRDDPAAARAGRLAEELDRLLSRDFPSGEELRALAEIVAWTLVTDPGRLRELLRLRLLNPTAIGLLVSALPDSLLARVLHLLRPEAYERVLRVADLLAGASHSTGDSPRRDIVRRTQWRFIFEHLVAEGRLYGDADFSRGLAARLGEELFPGDAEFPFRLTEQLALDMMPSDGDLIHRILRAITTTAAHPEWTGGRAADSGTAPTDAVRDLSEARPTSPEVGEELYVDNAGLVLLSPFLPRLFATLELVKGSEFETGRAAERAVHILQFVVDEEPDSHEFKLLLNKILCGVDPSWPIPRRIEVTTSEREVIDGMLEAAIGHWSALGSTSIAGLRESFLRRRGRLLLGDDEWQLSVEARPFDMLIDQIPWGFRSIKFPWMRRILRVDWR